MTTTSTPGDYYDRCRKEAEEALARLNEARASGADYATLRRLERELEQARNTGD